MASSSIPSTTIRALRVGQHWEFVLINATAFKKESKVFYDSKVRSIPCCADAPPSAEKAINALHAEVFGDGYWLDVCRERLAPLTGEDACQERSTVAFEALAGRGNDEFENELQSWQKDLACWKKQAGYGDGDESEGSESESSESEIQRQPQDPVGAPQYRKRLKALEVRLQALQQKKDCEQLSRAGKELEDAAEVTSFVATVDRWLRALRASFRWRS